MIHVYQQIRENLTSKKLKLIKLFTLKTIIVIILILRSLLSTIPSLLMELKNFLLFTITVIDAFGLTVRIRAYSYF
jgi:hypothetical protein